MIEDNVTQEKKEGKKQDTTMFGGEMHAGVTLCRNNMQGTDGGLHARHP